MEKRYELRNRSNSESHVECKFCDPPTPLALKSSLRKGRKKRGTESKAVTASSLGIEVSTSESSGMTTPNPAVASVTGSLEGYLFQLSELMDELEDVSTLISQDLHRSLDDLKDLRFTIVKSNAELKQLLGNDYPADKGETVKTAMDSSKAKITSIRGTLTDREQVMLKEEEAKRQARDQQTAEESKGRLFAFNAMLSEIKSISSDLVDNYDLSEDDSLLTTEVVVTRKENKSKYAADVQRVRQLYDRLLGYTDVIVQDEEKVLENQRTKLESLEVLKANFESKLLKDLEEFDLTEQKMKLAVQAKTDIRKFSGSLEKGTDFYTFKSKIQKAYAKFPRSVVVERLINNHLEGRAKECIGTLEDIEVIWERLKKNFGNTEEMLQFQFKKINQLGHISLQKTFVLKKHYLQKLVNVMQDVLDLATEHDLLGELHYGNQLNKIAKLMDDCVEGKWWKIVAKEDVEKAKRWERMLQFLNNLLKVVQVRAAEAEVEVVGAKKKEELPKGSGGSTFVASDACNLCGDKHPSSNSTFVLCKKFLELDIKEQASFVRSKKYCMQCLDGTSKWFESQHKCSTTWMCKHESHDKFKKKYHFLLCVKHAGDPANKELYEEFKKEVLKAEWQKKLHGSAFCMVGNRTTQDSFSVEQTGFQGCIDPRNDGTSAYILQQIPLLGHEFNAMFDSGCRDTVFRDKAVDLIPEDHKENTQKGPLVIGGVGGQNAISTKGAYAVKLPIHDGSLVKFCGVSLDVVTGTMPSYPVGEAFKSIVEDYIAQGGDVSDLPAVPQVVGGETDFLIGIQYNYFQPRMIHILTTGLAIYLSPFVRVDGTRGCIGGPHDVFEQCERQFYEQQGSNYVEFRAFLQQQMLLFNNGIRVCLDIGDLQVNKNLVSRPIVVNMESLEPKPAVLLSTRFQDAEKAGSIIEYRCQKCRGCKNCKKAELFEKISIKEEDEQNLIQESVAVDLTWKEAVAYLPFTDNPDEKLASNSEVAMRVYRQQTKMLEKKPRLKKAIKDSEAALQEAGFVDWVSNLPLDVQESISKAAVQYVLPWRCVENVNSLSTPVRLVFDATMVTSTGQSLNDIVAKGHNSLNSMLGIFIQFRIWKTAFTTDAKKLYNHVKLSAEHWRFQLYLWHNSLGPSLEPSMKAILTVIYGIKSSGNQATYALRKLADMMQDQFPEAALAIRELTYMDDTAGGTMDEAKIDTLTADIVELLAAGGFSTKGFTISGRKPPPLLSKDGISVNVIGSKWLSEMDRIQLNIGPVNFAKKHRGRKEKSLESLQIPKKLTKRICTGKVGEMFDLTGLALPVTSEFKVGLHELHAVYGWEDKMSEADRNLWSKHFDMMNNLSTVVWGRGVLPPDAANHDIELIGAGDASEKLACAACYIRFKRMDGSYSCKLLMAKSKIIPEGMSIPRAELLAMVLNVHVVEIVKRALKHFNIVKTIYVLDSEIGLYWIASQTKPLKPWVRNRVIEILRFTVLSDWFHVKSEDNPADLPTRKSAKLVDIDEDSEWINGKPWMHVPLEELYGTVLNDVKGIKLRSEQVAEVKKEQMKVGSDLCNTGIPLASPDSQISSADSAHATQSISQESDSITWIIRERLNFSRYLVDPNKFRFTKVARVKAIVIKAARNWLEKIGRNLTNFPLVNNKCQNIPSIQNQVQKFQLDPQVKVVSAADVSKAPIPTFITTASDVNKPQLTTKLDGIEMCVVLSDTEIQYSLDYLFRKGTEELKSFVHSRQYENISVEKEGILYYTGRLCSEDISFEGNNNITQKMIDLTKETFVVPIIDKNSPLAFSIINDVHWYHVSARHAGVETTIRALMTIVHIINVRQLVKLFKKNCKRCRYIMKRTLDVMMAKGSKSQLHVAPPFYVTQTDLCGSFSSYSTHHKRTTVKVWIVAFVCSTTGMTSLKIMQGYDTAQFILAFTRFACELGFPKKLLIDAGSQLVSGCENAVLNMSDLKGQLNREYGIEFATAPVGGHNFHGKVERKIRTVRESLERSVHNARLSVLEWETLCSEISNSINDLPVAIGNETEELENLDLITPNRLRLGRNNSRSPVGQLEVTGKLDRLLTLKMEVFQSWWETWLFSAPPKLVPHPKWFKSDIDLKVGDIVLFDKAEGSVLVGDYHYGIVEETYVSRDDRVRSVKLRYRNAEEATGFCTTKRAARGLVVIHRVDEIDLMEELGNAALDATGYYLYTEGIMKDHSVKT